MNKPNIVFIMADDMGFGDVGCNNPESKIPTQNMDRLATEGIRLTDAHSPFAVCSPTRYGVLTGRYCWRTPLMHGVFGSYEPPLIEKDRLTVAKLLKRHGYTTASVGKWHLGLGFQLKDGEHFDFPPTFLYTGVDREFEEKIDFSKPITGGPIELGFDYFFGTAGCSTGGRPFAFFENDQTVGQPEYREGTGMTTPGWENKKVDPTFAEKAIAFIEKQADSDDPFFLYLTPSAPHEPCRPVDVPDFASGKSKAGARGDLVWLVDWMVGQVLDTLKQTGKADNTLVIVTSDNGATPGDVAPKSESGETQWETYGHKSCGDYRGYKAHSWEGGHREPFLARWPGIIEPGLVRDDLCDLIDFMATCSAIVGDELKGEEGQDSLNMLPVLMNQELSEPYRKASVYMSSYGTYALRTLDWKLIHENKTSGGWGPPRGTRPVPGGPGQLYNIKEDVYETNDLFDQMLEKTEELIEQLKHFTRGKYPTTYWTQKPLK